MLRKCAEFVSSSSVSDGGEAGAESRGAVIANDVLLTFSGRGFLVFGTDVVGWQCCVVFGGVLDSFGRDRNGSGIFELKRVAESFGESSIFICLWCVISIAPSG